MLEIRMLDMVLLATSTVASLATSTVDHLSTIVSTIVAWANNNYVLQPVWGKYSHKINNIMSLEQPLSSILISLLGT